MSYPPTVKDIHCQMQTMHTNIVMETLMLSQGEYVSHSRETACAVQDVTRLLCYLANFVLSLPSNQTIFCSVYRLLCKISFCLCYNYVCRCSQSMCLSLPPFLLCVILPLHCLSFLCSWKYVLLWDVQIHATSIHT